MKGIRGTAVLSLVLAGTLAACGSDSSGPDDDRRTIEMRDNAFSPVSVTVSAGTTVRWVNEGEMVHNTTGDGNVWASANLSPGQSFERSFNTAGTFEYECTLHEGMTGTIMVN